MNPIVIIIATGAYILVAGIGLGIVEALQKDETETCIKIILWPFVLIGMPIYLLFKLSHWLGRAFVRLAKNKKK